jgi:hypothetical protein
MGPVELPVFLRSTTAPWKLHHPRRRCSVLFIRLAISTGLHTVDITDNYFFLRRLRRSRRFFEPIFLLRRGLAIATSNISYQRTNSFIRTIAERNISTYASQLPTIFNGL